jgi:hypothetical protein
MHAQEEELEAAKAGAQEEFDQSVADLEAIHKILSSPFIQRDAMRTAGEQPCLKLDRS